VKAKARLIIKIIAYVIASFCIAWLFITPSPVETAYFTFAIVSFIVIYTLIGLILQEYIAPYLILLIVYIYVSLYYTPSLNETYIFNSTIPVKMTKYFDCIKIKDKNISELMSNNTAYLYVASDKDSRDCVIITPDSDETKKYIYRVSSDNRAVCPYKINKWDIINILALIIGGGLMLL